MEPIADAQLAAQHAKRIIDETRAEWGVGWKKLPKELREGALCRLLVIKVEDGEVPARLVPTMASRVFRGARDEVAAVGGRRDGLDTTTVQCARCCRPQSELSGVPTCLDGQAHNWRRRAPCPDGKPGCEAMHWQAD